MQGSTSTIKSLMHSRMSKTAKVIRPDLVLGSPMPFSGTVYRSLYPNTISASVEEANFLLHPRGHYDTQSNSNSDVTRELDHTIGTNSTLYKETSTTSLKSGLMTTIGPQNSSPSTPPDSASWIMTEVDGHTPGQTTSEDTIWTEKAFHSCTEENKSSGKMMISNVSTSTIDISYSHTS